MDPPSPAPAPERRTLLSLPPEILISCLLLPSRHYGYDLKPPLPPKNALLVCRRLYTIAAPCLYAHLWVEPHGTGLGQSPLVPLLAATQRPAFSLPPWQRMADPAWVRALTILPSEPHPSHDPLLCRVLGLVLPAMRLRSLRWEGRQSDEGVARLVAQQEGLETVCCRLGGPLWRTGLKGLTEIVAWHDELLPYEDGNGTGLLHGSAETVETLHLAVGYPFDGIADVALQILKGVHRMPKMRALRLTGFQKEAVAAIERVVAFASVEEFQIMRGAGLDALRGKDLSSAHTLAGNATPRGLVELLNGCEARGRLRDLRVRLVDCTPEDHAPADHRHEPPPPPPGTAIIDALGRHGAALTTLVLAHDTGNGIVTNDPALLREKDVARVVEYCPCLEELSIRVGLEDVIKVSPLLAKLARLSHLALDIVHDSPIANDLSNSPPYRLPPSTMPLWSVDNDWFSPEQCEWPPVPPAPVTPLEVVLSHLLAEGPPSLQSVRLDIRNTNPESPFHHGLRNRYEMRPGTPADRRLRAPDDYLYAPPGHRYAWSGGEFVVVSWDRFRAGKGRETFVSSSFWTSSFEAQQLPV
ncbi:hypothetical protein DFP73DRAFT_564255 [Morchella snyderi]|nr:hypothetical protein DFP73DRAFT_564255 [Morchella snyderi]